MNFEEDIRKLIESPEGGWINSYTPLIRYGDWDAMQQIPLQSKKCSISKKGWKARV